MYDGTDAAHPAWWRGCDHGVVKVVEVINKILDCKESGPYHFVYEGLTELSIRLVGVLKQLHEYSELVEKLSDVLSDIYLLVEGKTETKNAAQIEDIILKALRNE